MRHVALLFLESLRYKLVSMSIIYLVVQEKKLLQIYNNLLIFFYIYFSVNYFVFFKIVIFSYLANNLNVKQYHLHLIDNIKIFNF